MNSFYSAEELKALNLKLYGDNVLISRKSSIYGADKITIGNNVRIDDFCILSVKYGEIIIGNFVQLTAYVSLYAGDSSIHLYDFVGIGTRTCVMATSDDYSGETMTNPMIPEKYKAVNSCPIIIKKHSIIGTGCTILPGVTIAEGCSFGAMTLINKNTEQWSIYVGIPAKKIKDRKRDLLILEKAFHDEVE